MQVNGSNPGNSGSNSTKKAQMQQRFDQEKAAALSAANGNPQLTAQINAITPQKGAINQLEELLNQANSQGKAQGAQQQQQPPRTLGIG